ncbi:hypothetical protein HBH56_168540 [Parastagonospora nodorum]|nr:hypothetical protein HBH56_168540 [Parastagonospora nodorum]KAH3936516.1 hypothetical protein HBH54_031630 [Parastagonospora nodorum]KAH4056845.1 hypothetical protein HBH49_038020 [Parastagonospora nodorum]KAH4076959.1 hypothetical protein HBH50_012920 [Parastagonospora nodorum]KAH4095561.1 hypothetical protein HBH48_044890 [Parastagonospora nodorum]
MLCYTQRFAGDVAIIPRRTTHGAISRHDLCADPGVTIYGLYDILDWPLAIGRILGPTETSFLFLSSVVRLPP